MLVYVYVLDIIAGFTFSHVLLTPLSYCLASIYQSTVKSKVQNYVKDGLPLKEKSTIIQVSPQHRIRDFHLNAVIGPQHISIHFSYEIAVVIIYPIPIYIKQFDKKYFVVQV